MPFSLSLTLPTARPFKVSPEDYPCAMETGGDWGVDDDSLLLLPLWCSSCRYGAAVMVLSLGVNRIFHKIERFKRVADLPAMLVGVEGLPKASPHVSLLDDPRLALWLTMLCAAGAG